MIKISRRQAGDTLVEVLLATVILSIVLSGAYTLSNRATRINQQAFERTQITNLLQQQAELARSARDSYNPQSPATQPWDGIVGRAQGNVADLGTACNDLSTLSRSGAFHIEPNLSTSNGIDVINLFRVWTEVERGTDSEYWDVHVYGCWEAVGNVPNNFTSLVIRLADPS